MQISCVGLLHNGELHPFLKDFKCFRKTGLRHSILQTLQKQNVSSCMCKLLWKCMMPHIYFKNKYINHKSVSQEQIPKVPNHGKITTMMVILNENQNEITTTIVIFSLENHASPKRKSPSLCLLTTHTKNMMPFRFPSWALKLIKFEYPV